MARKKTSRLNITSIEVAKRAGVSQPTVSRVFQGGDNVSDELRERVLQAARELGYHPNMIARSLSSHKTNIIGVVLSDLSNRFYAQMLAMLSQRLQQDGKQILFFESPTEQNIGHILERVQEYQVDGLVVSSSALTRELTDECSRIRIPVVLINRYTGSGNLFTVSSDSVEAGRMVANYLLDKGYSRFAYIGGRITSTTSQDRGKGFTDRLRERGIEHCALLHVEYEYSAGRAALRQLFQGDGPPNAVFCANDFIAMGAFDAAKHDLDLRVPEDVAIVGFDDIDLCAWESYNLTSVRQPITQMVDQICAYLQAAPDTSENRLTLLSCEIVERGTS